MIDNSQTVTLNAPKGSATMKSSERGIGMSLHKFSFSKVCWFETWNQPGTWKTGTILDQFVSFWTGACIDFQWTNFCLTFRFLDQRRHSLSYLRILSKAKCLISWMGRMHWYSAMVWPMLGKPTQSKVKMETHNILISVSPMKFACHPENAG